ncbi:xanthine dehydrogenase family protein molybdopterin-binding subunit [Amycolatopsis sp. FDAARGOS 1241]|uniref:xanthine dehydrogenase family protein molybdopterin-binding subunit n=1 Tax=Amycolatopsis sp. FDAARGOS 1241 TaxID=2778070 RepID=UPI0019523A7A|nr:xanthine dehydrogenase family protein molybdopterin-binding subunit [Amycolatopsis sp. FDAARGOS 1241]QRP50333.1 xanthine dehydrogenase family protein molybdopterin-binding subunit [Amycolatopsis sp. FDAARGOS 1241]
MTTTPALPFIGTGLSRVDGPRKVSGQAPYSSDFSAPGQAHAALVQSTIAAGRITAIDTAAAESAPGVVKVFTHLNVPALVRGPMTPLGTSPPAPLQDDRVLHHGQHVALAVAETREQATAATALVRVEYAAEKPILDPDDPRAVTVDNPWGLDHERGDLDAGLAAAHVTVETEYTTSDNTNNPLGLFATLAEWDGDRLTVHDSTQWPSMVRETLAAVFGVPEESVRVLSPFVGGGFGAGLRAWPHVILAVLAARELGRPVKLVLTRPQMFTSVGHRPRGAQWVRLGASADGRLLALEHRSRSLLAAEDDDYEPFAAGSAVAYACPNVRTTDQQVRANLPAPVSMRAPAEAQGNFALESAMDELAVALRMDPVDLRLRNYAEVHPGLDLPWSEKSLRDCYTVGAERFGWSRRAAEPRSSRDGHWLVGQGMAGVSYPWYQAPCRARATVTADERATVSSAAIDIGTGTYTVMTQLAAELLGLPADRVRFDLGDTDLPKAPQAGGSGLTGALGSAVHDACARLRAAVLDLVRDDAASPLRGRDPADVVAADGRIHLRDEPGRGESYAAVLARHGLPELTAEGSSTPADPRRLGMAPAGAFGAHFAEVRVDEDLGLIRVTRVVSVVDGGRILNEKTATSQIIGGVIGAIGMALFEDTITDPTTGRIANATFGDYLVPVHADIPDIDVTFVGEPDRMNPIGTKGVGEVGLVGVAAAVANAVHHATGIRVRSLPITLDALL